MFTKAELKSFLRSHGYKLLSFTPFFGDIALVNPPWIEDGKTIYSAYYGHAKQTYNVGTDGDPTYLFNSDQPIIYYDNVKDLGVCILQDCNEGPIVKIHGYEITYTTFS